MRTLFWIIGSVGCLWAWKGTGKVAWLFFAGVECGFAYDSYIASFDWEVSR